MNIQLFGNHVQLKIADGDPIDLGAAGPVPGDSGTDSYRLIPRAFIISLQWPNGGFVYNKPIGVTVEHAGASRVAVIPDPTRAVQWTLAALYVVVIYLLIRTRYTK